MKCLALVSVALVATTGHTARSFGASRVAGALEAVQSNYKQVPLICSLFHAISIPSLGLRPDPGSFEGGPEFMPELAGLTIFLGLFPQ